MVNALKEYHQDVKTRQFPAAQNTYPIDPVQLEKFYAQEREKNGVRDQEEERAAHAM